MTRYKAIKILEYQHKYGNMEADVRQALAMGIDALSNNVTESPNEAIKRQNDVIDVVRCRDCRWFDKGENEVDAWECCTRIGHHPQSDGFCAWGDRRE